MSLQKMESVPCSQTLSAYCKLTFCMRFISRTHLPFAAFELQC